MVRRVKKERFTLQALVLWGAVPKEAKARILKNCFCPKCREPAEMLEPKGVEKKGGLGADRKMRSVRWEGGEDIGNVREPRRGQLIEMGDGDG